ncbi:uncharacterized protein ACB058_013219 [Synchiropus picturatus]
MNAKLAVALILTLQVSLSLCEVPPPSPELVLKYNDLKATFFRRLSNLIQRAPHSPVAQTDEGQKAINLAKSAAQDPKAMAVAKVATALAEEMEPHMEVARNKALGVYEAYIRPVAKDHMEEFIKNMKAMLDRVMPAH